MKPTDPPSPPLMSPASPSYGRARSEAEHPSPVAPAQFVASLARLFEAEANARDALAAATAHASTDSERAALDASEASHAARQETLAELIRAEGGAPPRASECRVILDVAEISRADAGTSALVVRIEKELARVYAAAAADADLDEHQRRRITALASTDGRVTT